MRSSKTQAVIDQNPFWFYEPINSTELPETRKAWYEEKIKPYLDLDFPEASAGYDVHMDTTQTLFVLGGNQSGKTVSSIMDVLIMSTGFIPFSLQKTYPREKIIRQNIVTVRVMGVSSKVIRSTLIPTFRRWCPPQALVNGAWESSFVGGGLHLKRLDGGDAFFEFMSYAQKEETFGGPARDILLFDELPPYDIYLESLIRLTTAKQPHILIAATPTEGISSWVYEHVLNAEYDDASPVSVHRLCSLFNPYINTDLVEQIAQTSGGRDMARMRFMGEFVSRSGFVYGDAFQKHKHVIKPFPIEPYTHVVVRGIDPHYSKPTVMVEAAIDRENIIYVCGMYVAKGDSLEDVKKNIGERAKRHNYRLYSSVVDVSCNVTSQIFNTNIYEELRKEPYRVPMLRPSNKKSGVVENDIFRIREYLSTGKLFFFDTPELRPMVHAISTIEQAGRVYNMRSGKTQDKVLEMKHDAHACLRYIFQLPLRYIPLEEQNQRKRPGGVGAYI